jgi:preprotein translocase subunit Sec63
VTYNDLHESLRIFGLGDRSSLKEIKSRHRQLVKRYHPDSGNTDDKETIQKVNAAYQVILEYVTDYRFSFAEEEFYEQSPEERLRRQFMTDPIWGDK